MTDQPESNAPANIPPQAPQGAEGLPQNVAAGLACLFPLIGGIVFLLLEKKNAFVRFYAMQSVFFGGASLAVSIAFQILRAILTPIPVIGIIMVVFLGLVAMALGIAWFVIYIVMLVKSFSGVEWEIPYLGPLARKQFATSSI